MALEKEITCPKCKAEDVEKVSSLYQSLSAKNAGTNLFLEDAFRAGKKILPYRQRERLLHRLTPPKEPKKDLPAGMITAMAFVLSWMVTAGLVVWRLGYKAYSLTSILTAVVLAFPFYFIFTLVVHDFQRDIQRYRRLMAVWKKQYFCNNCYHVFIPKDES